MELYFFLTFTNLNACEEIEIQQFFCYECLQYLKPITRFLFSPKWHSALFVYYNELHGKQLKSSFSFTKAGGFRTGSQYSKLLVSHSSFAKVGESFFFISKNLICKMCSHMLMKLGWFFYIINSFVTNWDYIYMKNWLSFFSIHFHAILSMPRLPS